MIKLLYERTFRPIYLKKKRTRSYITNLVSSRRLTNKSCTKDLLLSSHYPSFHYGSHASQFLDPRIPPDTSLNYPAQSHSLLSFCPPRWMISSPSNSVTKSRKRNRGKRQQVTNFYSCHYRHHALPINQFTNCCNKK